MATHTLSKLLTASSRCFNAAWGVALVAAGLAACGGGDPPRQDPQSPQSQMVGTVTSGGNANGKELARDVALVGATGLMRTAFLDPGQTYTVSTTEAEPPYAMRGVAQVYSNESEVEAEVEVYAVVSQQGRANITPLTTLLMAQVFGQDPSAVFNSFGKVGGVDTSRVTAANLTKAQTDLSTFLQAEIGYTLPAAVGDLATAQFSAAPGDPMYDAVVAFNARLASLGRNFSDVSGRVALAAKLCLTEQVTLTIAGAPASFCPQTKSSQPRESDASILDVVFVDLRGNRLAVSVRGDAVLDVSYQGVDGPSYGCSGSGCTGITLAPPAADLTRRINLAALTLSAGDKRLVIDGQLTLPAPGVVLPVLPCENNLFFVVLPEGSVNAGCGEFNDTVGLGGALGEQSGVAPSRATYSYTGPHGALFVSTDANDAVIGVGFSELADDGFTPLRSFGCSGADCAGITLGPVTENTDITGPDTPLKIRTVSFADTPLRQLDGAGGFTEVVATLAKASITTVFYNAQTISYPPLADCAPGETTVQVQADNASFNVCAPDLSQLRRADGAVLLSLGNLGVTLAPDGSVKNIFLNAASATSFGCSVDCPGVTVGAAAPDGSRTLKFDAAVLHESLVPFYGPRTLTLDSAVLQFGPPQDFEF